MDNLPAENALEGEYIPAGFEDRWYQEEATVAALEAIKDKHRHPIIAVPTGGGKTHIIGKIINRYLYQNPTSNVVVLSHVKEILEQDYKAIEKYIDVSLGLYSSMLNSRTIERVTVAGIQSVYKRAIEFDDVGLIIIDECHLVTDDNEGMYRTFLAEFNANFLGLTATPFRPRGYLHLVKNALFTDICYDLTSSVNFRRLIDEGYLCKLFSKATHLKMDVSDIGMQGGDFNNKQMNKKFNTEEVTEIALDETIKIGGNYKKWLIFAISIEHAEAIRDYLNDAGINTGIVHSKMKETGEDRDLMLERFRIPFYRAMVNVNVLTTGLDIPDIDLIVMLRPTQSPVIYAQSAGRGLRPAEGKDHCLVLDFAGNVARHGPVDDIHIRQKGEKRSGEPVTKECPACMALCHPIMQICEACGHVFEFKVKIAEKPSDLDILKKSKKGWINVNLITINKHKKIHKPDSIRIDYVCGLRRFSQWASIKSNSQYAAHSARYVLSKFYDFPEDFEFTVDNILELRDEFKTPKRIYVDQTENYPTVEDIDFIGVADETKDSI
jgi:DNA repair protein RadD